MSATKIGIDARMFSDNFTGIGRYTFELTKRLFENHVKNIEWVIFLNDPEFDQFDFPTNVRKVRVNAKHYSLAEQTKFLQILNREQCDLVHFTHFNVPLGYRRKFVVTIHDTTLSFFPGQNTSWLKQMFYRAVIKNAVRRSASILAVSENTKADVVELFNAPKDKIKVVYNGLNNDFKPVKELKQKSIRNKYKVTNPFLFYSGVWREHKNLARFFEAFADLKLANKLPGVDLVLTGKPDRELLELANNLGIEEYLKPIGKIPFQDLVTLMSAAEMFVFPSLYEGFGLPPLEAMKVHTPAVVSRVSAIPEVCGEAALYFDPSDTHDIATKIEQLYKDKSLQKDLIEAGKLQAKKFNWDVCAKATWRTYQSVLQ